MGTRKDFSKFVENSVTRRPEFLSSLVWEKWKTLYFAGRWDARQK